jgi:predicted AlkP superfamily phosphohydrolase/phosphomutase
MDNLLGRILDRIDDQTVLMVISDHGFNSFERGVNLNTWLCQNGFLALEAGAPAGGEWFRGVDWARTRAYALGLNGIYLNQKGRERAGIVPAGREAEQLKKELREKLRGLVDPQTGRVAIRAVFDSQFVYAGPYAENAPDLIVGYNQGYRAAWESVKGKITGAVFEDNSKAWSGDHCIDPRLVPGVLFCNRKISSHRPAIIDIAPTVLELFGLGLPPHLEGKPLVFSGGAAGPS